MFGIQERTYHHLFIAPLLTDESCSWSASGFVFLCEGFVPSSDPHWTWKSALAFQILCDIGARIPEFHLEMIKATGFDVITCEDLWHAFFRIYLVKRSWIKCLPAPSFSSDLSFFSEMLSPPAQGILLGRAISTRVMCHCCFTHRPFLMPHSLHVHYLLWMPITRARHTQWKWQHPQRNLPLKDSLGILKRKSEMHSGGILCWRNDVLLHLLTTLGYFAWFLSRTVIARFGSSQYSVNFFSLDW